MDRRPEAGLHKRLNEFRVGQVDDGGLAGDVAERAFPDIGDHFDLRLHAPASEDQFDVAHLAHWGLAERDGGAVFEAADRVREEHDKRAVLREETAGADRGKADHNQRQPNQGEDSDNAWTKFRRHG